MRRHPALAALSRDHHAALVLAKRASHADAAAAEPAVAVADVFNGELEPHFCFEEDALLPPLEAAGLAELVARTRREHAELRALVVQLQSGAGAALRPFGRLLEAHVRFEERELFVAAETHLDQQTLAALAAASRGAP
jgi:hemerythrin-like domain-containing protein